MFTRYKTDEKGRRSIVAKVYTSKEHNIHTSQIDKDCLWVVKKLWASGHKAYIVGGAVRDMLLGRRPKDFDVATSASPRQVQSVFWNSRAIGKRFRIVHIFFANKIIEVTTFRSDEENFEEGKKNIFGTIEQDSRRRDFSLNALYYNPLDGHLIDFNNSLEDIRKKKIRSLIPLSYSFKEDPVRMIRAVKYMCTTGFSLAWDVRWALRRDCAEVEKVSVSRLTDEMLKIFTSASSAKIIAAMHRYRLLGYIMPGYDVYVRYAQVSDSLVRLDELVSDARKEGRDLAGGEILYIIANPLVMIEDETLGYDEQAKEIFRQIKVLVAPMTPPNFEIEKAAEMILSERGYRSSASKKKLPARKKPSNIQKARARAGARKNVRKPRPASVQEQDA